MNLDVTICAVAVLRIQIMLWAGRLDRANIVGHAMTGQTELWHSAGGQKPGISRTVWRMTSNTPFCLHWGMFESEWTLLVRMTLNTGRICAGRQPRLFEFKTTMRVVTVAALQRAFENLVVEGQIELMLDFGMAAQTQLRFARFEKLEH